MNRIAFYLLLCFTYLSSSAKISLPSIIDNRMVLQQNSNVVIWGKSDKKGNVTVIDNNGSFEDLYRKAEEEYQNIGELSFDERYSLRGKVNFKDVAIKLGKAREIGTQTKLEQKQK